MKPRVLMLDVRKQPVPVHVSFRNGDRLSISVHPDLTVTAVAPKARPRPSKPLSTGWLWRACIKSNSRSSAPSTSCKRS